MSVTEDDFHFFLGIHGSIPMDSLSWEIPILLQYLKACLVALPFYMYTILFVLLVTVQKYEQLNNFDDVIADT